MTYKDLIFSAIGDKLTEADIEKVLFDYEVETTNNKLFAENSKGQKIELSLTVVELTTVRTVLISKVTKQVKKQYPDFVLKNIIIELVNSKKEINIFIEFTTGEIISLL